MDAAWVGLITAGSLVAIAIALSIVALIRSRRRHGRSAGDDQMRAGSSGGTDSSNSDSGNADSGDAALRATGTNAWMRPGGGGI